MNALRFQAGKLCGNFLPRIAPPKLADPQIAALFDFLARPSEEPPDNLSGDGIVTLSLGPRFALMAEIQRRMLRTFNADIPLQIWNDGHIVPSDDPATEWIDIRGWRERDPPTKQGAWESKTYAIMRSGFRRAFFLDADAYPVANPAPAFAALEIAPLAFWLDLHGTSVVSWKNVGIEGHGTPAIQGGHMLFDIAGAWRFLSVSDWISARSDYFYRWGGYGEQGSHETSLAAGTVAHTIIANCRWEFSGSIICDYGGNPLVVHRISKLWPDCLPHWNLSLPGERLVQQFYRELNREGYRKSAFGPCPQRRPRPWNALQKQRQKRILGKVANRR